MPRRSAADSYSNPPDIEAYELRRLAEAEQARIRAEAKIQARLEAPQAAQNDAEARERGRLRAQAEASEAQSAELRAKLAEVVGDALGDLPATAQDWADSSANASRLALLHPDLVPAVRHYEQVAMKRAAVLEPQKWGRDPMPAPSGGNLTLIQVAFVSAAPAAAIEGESRRVAVEGSRRAQ